MILVYLEHSNSKLSKGGKLAISAALQAKEKHGYSRVVGVLLGDAGVAEAAKEASGYGLDEVVYVASSALEPYLALNFQSVLLKICEELNPKLVLALSNTRGKDFMPRLAQALEAGQASDVLAFIEGGAFRRPMYAGDVIAEVEVTTDVKVATIRGTAFDEAAAGGSECPVRAIDVAVEASESQTFVSFEATESERPELTEADVVVSGGRALKSEENFEKYLFPLADALNAALGASRAAVDSGYAPNDWQVGQTGKVVAPNLYFAVGISGAIQHLAGMKDSKVIVSINKDPEAPIFEISDYGLVGDLFEILPQLVEEIKKVKQAS